MRAIDQLIIAIKTALPGALVEQIRVKFPTDDDGLWFVTHPDADVEINLESSTGEFPFVIESSGSNAWIKTFNVDGTVVAVCRIMARHMNINYLQRTAAAGRREDFDKYMSRVPDVPPTPVDEIKAE